MIFKPSNSPSASRNPTGTNLTLWLGLTAIVLFFIANGIISFLNTNTLRRNASAVAQTFEVIVSLEDVLSAMKDAETGQRGYLITGDDGYLVPHASGVRRVNQRLDELQQLVQGNPTRQSQISQLREHVDSKLQELAETIDIRRSSGFEAAKDVVVSDRGKAAMDLVRSIVNDMQTEERSIRGQRLRETDEAYQTAIASGVLTCLLGVFLSGIVTYLVRRTMKTRLHEEWLLAGQHGLSQVMVGDPTLEQLGERVLKFLSVHLDAHAGAFFANDQGRFRRFATYGVPAAEGTPLEFEIGDGLLGQAAKDGRTFVVQDVPEGYLSVSSAFGQGKPKHLIITPFVSDSMTNAVLELGFLHPLAPSITELLDKLSETVSVAVRSSHYRKHLHDLLIETQRQSEELQTQSEELRVSNEELEEQSRALKESQVRLEQQQVELEQTNAQIEEHAQSVESQRDDLARAQAALQRQAGELEQASQYKSDFLANMSHELRTPLNSSLILAKLLADNPEGNLTPEQVASAATIHSAGNDLLALINDILDLSKIEAGRMEIRPESIWISQIANNIENTLGPLATQKGLTFQVKIAAGCPESLITDQQRIEQILKNLLSNAIKFTDEGEVVLNIRPSTDNRLIFEVTDTGIGIAEEQQALIFEAFRQVDGAANRRYNGTGLGLSISRQLVRLLGGEIRLSSVEGKGSTFTVVLPVEFDSIQTAATENSSPQSFSQASPPAPTPPKPTVSRPAVPPVLNRSRVKDDRAQLTGDRPVILVVEDDESFAKILYTLSHELEFQCLIAMTAEEAITVAIQYLPSAVILDLGLPDHSGLSVLDRLKHDARTQHIPVHVISASDFSEAAFSLGAVGYMIKPVTREKLTSVLKGLETRLTQRVRRVLLVEDDRVQLESLGKLLGSHQVETVGARSAAECLNELKNSTFDCMVLDLSLPDASGYSLLETLSREDAYAFPPVIVYTGADLNSEEEHKLRRYSKSIIIKGAKSPERLLDEVTLFLHQVVADLPQEHQKMIRKARSREAALEGRRILVVEDDVRNVFALTSILEPRGAIVQIARNGVEALKAMNDADGNPDKQIDLILMDVMMPEMDGLTATREIRKREEWQKMPIIVLTAKAMKEDQENCLAAGANDYMAKPLDVEKLLSLVRVWIRR